MKYIIVDLEATCEENSRTFEKEIIEIGAVKVNEKLQVEGEFDAFVRPLLNTQLTDFCKKLTTITQEDVDNAKSFPVVIETFKEWIGLNEEYILCSWGQYDKHQFVNDCRRHGLDFTWTRRHISLKHQFAEIYDIRPCGMSKALSILKIPANGVLHRGIDDSRNITEIFKACYGKWSEI